ncbi:MAG: hypothetical protein ACTSPV_03085 [Candidatus Hodarchaeales archaeon]
MNDFLFYTFLILSFVRLIGLCVSIDLFLFKRDGRYKFLIISWSIWVLSAIFPILSETIESTMIVDIFLVINSDLILLGLLFIIAWALSYYRPMSIKLLVYLTVLIMCLPLILYFIGGYDVALNFNSLIFLGLFFFILINTWRKRSELKTIIGSSIKWLYVTNAFGLLYIINGFLTTFEGYSFGLYQTDNPIIIIRYYFFVIGATLLIVTLIIKWEQSVSEIQKFQMKDVYSHKVGNILQIILSNLESFTPTKEEDIVILELIKDKCLNAGELIKEIREI